MSDTLQDAIYNRRILGLASGIERIGRLPAPQARAHAVSRLCGSTVHVDMVLAGDVVEDFAHEVRACILGQTSSAIMAHNIIGTSAGELRDIGRQMRAMLTQGGAPPSGRWRDLAILEPVRDYKARHASTLLTFDAVEDCLTQILGKPDDEREKQ